MAGMSELELMKQAIRGDRIDRVSKMIQQCVSPVTLRELRNVLTSDQDFMNHPAKDEFIGDLEDRIKVLES